MRKLAHNERIITRFLWKRKTLINGSHRFIFVKIFQAYQLDNNFFTGKFRGWRWKDIYFVK